MSSTAFTTLTSLPAVRTRAHSIYTLALQNQTTHFALHPDRLPITTAYVVQTILSTFPPSSFASIPPHGRWQHFESGGIPRLAGVLREWESEGVGAKERCRRLVDLFLVSVLLDAGAGDAWRFREVQGLGVERRGKGAVSERSEGLAVASLYMFLEGGFSGGRAGVVDGKGLETFSADTLAKGMQVSASNPLTGVEGRAALLQSLGSSLLAHPEIFGETGRPGNLVDYLLSTSQDSSTLDVTTLWSSLQTLLLPIWPTDRTTIDSKAIGDSWPLSTLRKSLSYNSSDLTSAIQPFHKLTQWLTYSLMVPFVRLLDCEWTNSHLLTGLPEYRNGGIFVDLGVLSLRPEALSRGLAYSRSVNPSSDLPMFDPADDVIVEWRALTVALLDVVHGMVNEELRKQGAEVELSLAQVLEAGTWKAGRLVAGKKRPGTKSSPILIVSDGTLF